MIFVCRSESGRSSGRQKEVFEAGVHLLGREVRLNCMCVTLMISQLLQFDLFLVQSNSVLRLIWHQLGWARVRILRNLVEEHLLGIF